MQVRCPNCGAILYSGEKPSDGQLPAKCWLCMTVVSPSTAAAKPAPRTAISEPARPSARRSSARLNRDSTSQTKSLHIPSDRTIKICVMAGKSQGMEFELSRPLMTIGRAGGDADIQIEDPEVSRLHCSVEVRGDAILLHDLHSTNGTFLGASRVLSARLTKTSRIRIGSSYLQILILSGGKQNQNLSMAPE